MDLTGRIEHRHNLNRESQHNISGGRSFSRPPDSGHKRINPEPETPAVNHHQANWMPHYRFLYGYPYYEPVYVVPQPEVVTPVEDNTSTTTATATPKKMSDSSELLIGIVIIAGVIVGLKIFKVI